MKITIEMDEQLFGTQIKFEDTDGGAATFENSVSAIISALDGITTHFIKQNELSDDDRTHLYDTFDLLFFRFMEKVFPDIQPPEFELTDAALLYAQDMIIDKAAKEGKTFEEAMKEYEDEAKAYVNKRMKEMLS